MPGPLRFAYQLRAVGDVRRSRRERHEFKSRSPGFCLCQVLCILERSRRVVFIQVSTINSVSQFFALYADGVDRNLAIRRSDRAARLLEKYSVPTVLLDAPRSDKDAVSHDYKPDSDEAMHAGARPNAQPLALAKSG